MIDLYLLCRKLNSKRSYLRQKADAIVYELYALLRRPFGQTLDAIGQWEDDFRRIYGDIAADLSGNRKLDTAKLLGRYGVIETDRQSARLLLFAIQTFFSLLMKYIAKNVLSAVYGQTEFYHHEIITGEFARRRGIVNYCVPDYYCWPLYEPKAASVLETIQDILDHCGRTTERLDNSGDLVKQLYEAVIPKELRHALGEFYTPDWLAEFILNGVTDLCAGRNIKELAVIDPTCGSGTFLTGTIALKRKNGCNLTDILTSVKGVDINPLAVLTAKTNYLLSVLDLLNSGPVTLPIFRADVITDHIPALGQADIVIGNPPWVNWEYMPELYRNETRGLWLEYGLVSAKGRCELSFSKANVSVLITSIAMDRLLKKDGVIGFIMGRSVFKSARNGAGFRRFQLRGDNIQVIRIEDLSGIKVFEDTAASPVIFFGRKGEKTVYPVPYGLWVKRADRKKYSFGAHAQLQEVMDRVDIVEQAAFPAAADDLSSVWVTAEREELTAIERVLGTNHYRARTGVFTGGANAVYWLKIHQMTGDLVRVSNIVQRAKRKSDPVTVELEKTFLFPMLRGGGVHRWKTTYDMYLLCPHTARTKQRPVPELELEAIAPETLRYLRRFRADLDSRRGFAGWEKTIQQEEFHTIARVGAYTFSPYKVVWRYIAKEFICAVAGPVDDPYLGIKPVLPNEKVMYISTDDEMEAYYLCGVLSSTLAANCVKSYMNPTSISAHVLEKLRLPDYDGNNPLHREIARLCQEGHRTDSAAACLLELDRLTERLYPEIG